MIRGLPGRPRVAALACAFVAVSAAAAEGAYLSEPPVAISATPISSTFSTPACDGAPLPRILTLEAAVDRALCEGDRSRQAWIQLKERAAALLQEKASYLPHLEATATRLGDDQQTHVPGHPEMSSHNVATTVTEGLQLNWLLYDFGARHDRVASAEFELIAARAGQDAALLDVFRQVSALYFAAQAAEAARRFAHDNEQRAEASLEAAAARAARGVVPVSDEYQARTALLSAQAKRLQAERESVLALSGLLQALRERPADGVELSQIDEVSPTDSAWVASVEALTRTALSDNPQIAEQQAHLRAAESSLAAVQRGAWPSISLAVNATRNDQPVSPLPGEPLFPARARDASVQLQFTLPLFEGGARNAQVQQAAQQVEERRLALASSRSDVEFAVWNDYRELVLLGQEMTVVSDLVSTAADSELAARERYVAGVGNITELLATQGALADARQQRLRALTRWQAARLRLCADLGSLPSMTP